VDVRIFLQAIAIVRATNSTQWVLVVVLAKPTSMAMVFVTMTASQVVLMQLHVTLTRAPR
jgi:hypothetical protein